MSHGAGSSVAYSDERTEWTEPAPWLPRVDVVLRIVVGLCRRRKLGGGYEGIIAGKYIAYRFSPIAVATPPRPCVGGTTGTLVVDMYTGYNAVTGVVGRERGGCLAHARRWSSTHCLTPQNFRPRSI